LDKDGATIALQWQLSPRLFYKRAKERGQPRVGASLLEFWFSERDVLRFFDPLELALEGFHLRGHIETALTIPPRWRVSGIRKVARSSDFGWAGSEAAKIRH
jgi:hypothetical protein